LTQAEAVQELIAAKSDQAVDQASDQLQGRLTEKIALFQKELTEIAAILEAWVDFPEEGLEFATLDELSKRLILVMEAMEHLVESFHDGRRLREGVSVCLAGAPNVGKSSLMNALCDRDRSIVTHIPGTTRDLVEDEIMLGGVSIKLIDTAGIRKTDELVEQEGIERTLDAMEKADLTLLVLDASRELSAEENSLKSRKKTLLIWNKIDLLESRENREGIALSAKSGEGIEKLQEWLTQNLFPKSDQVMITRLRHKEALEEAIEGCKRVIEGLKMEISPEFLCLDLRGALHALGRILGMDVTEDILSAIFSKFCLGK